MQPPMNSFFDGHMSGDDNMQKQSNDQMAMQHFMYLQQQQQQQQSHGPDYIPTCHVPQRHNSQYQQQHHRQGYQQYRQNHQSNAVLHSASTLLPAPHLINSHESSEPTYQTIPSTSRGLDLLATSASMSYNFGGSDPLATVPRTVDEHALLDAVSFGVGMPTYPIFTEAALPITRATSSQGYRSAFTASQYQQPVLSSIAANPFNYYSASPPFSSMSAGTDTSTGLLATPIPTASPYELETFTTPTFAQEMSTPDTFRLSLFPVPDHGLAVLSASPWDGTSLDSMTPGSVFDTGADLSRSPVNVAATTSPLVLSKGKRAAEAEHEHTNKKIKREALERVSNSASTAHQGQASSPGNTAAHAFQCSDCDCSSFTSQEDLDKHVHKEHGRYPCIFSFADGCKKRFSKKNEWKRHCITQHIVQEHYICSSEQCSAKSDVAFLRKDLFKAHLDRVHTPKHISEEHRDRQKTEQARRKQNAGASPKSRKKSAADKKAGRAPKDAVPFPHVPCSQEYRDVCRDHQQLIRDSLHARVKLPTDITCRLPGCGIVFAGSHAWHRYLEHVVKHLDCLAPETPDFCFGTTLAEYAVDIGILKAGDGSEPPQWTLVAVTADTVVHPKYRP